MSKHVINSPSAVVRDALIGSSYLNSSTVITAENATVLRSLTVGRVHLLSGGGSGHSPAHAGFVGEGMLSASVDGQIFASPNSRQVGKTLERVLAANAESSVLIFVKNYTGDVLQFGLARERYAAAHADSSTNRIRMIVVGDDVALPRSSSRLVGRRGLAATVLVYKIAGKLALDGCTLEEVEWIAKIVADRSGTIGIGLDHCSLPGAGNGGVKDDYLQDNELEVGMGIHNERGFKKVSPIPSAKQLVKDLLDTLMDTADPERAYLGFKYDGKDAVVLLINNLGALSDVELKIVVKEAVEGLRSRNVIVERVLAGLYMTALDLPGLSLSLILLPREAIPLAGSAIVFDSSLILDALDAPTEAPSWPWHYKGRPVFEVEEARSADPTIEALSTVEEREQVRLTPVDPKRFILALESGLESVIAAESLITHYDTVGGDGDAGETLSRGARGVLESLRNGKLDETNVIQVVLSIAEVADEKMGGTSGGLYSIFFNALAKSLKKLALETEKVVITIEIWAHALQLALNTLYEYTLARPPSRTLIDPLTAFILTLSTPNASALTSTFEQACDAARVATETTASLESFVGRSAYVDQDNLRKENCPDAGAYGVLMILDGIRKVACP